MPVKYAIDRHHILRLKSYGPSCIAAIHRFLVYSITVDSNCRTDCVQTVCTISYKEALPDSEILLVSPSRADFADETEWRYQVVDKIVAIGENKDEIWF